MSYEMELDWVSMGHRWYLGVGLASSYYLANRDRCNCSRGITLYPEVK